MSRLIYDNDEDFLSGEQPTRYQVRIVVTNAGSKEKVGPLIWIWILYSLHRELNDKGLYA